MIDKKYLTTKTEPAALKESSLSNMLYCVVGLHQNNGK